MNALEFTLLSVGPDEADINELLNAYDHLADKMAAIFRKRGDHTLTAIRRLVSSSFREYPTLALALNAAKSLGSSNGRHLSAVAQGLLSARRYTSTDIDNIGYALHEALSGSMNIPAPSQPKYSTARPTKLTKATDRSYATLLATLVPQGYSMTEVAAMWRKIKEEEGNPLPTPKPRAKRTSAASRVTTANVKPTFSQLVETKRAKNPPPEPEPEPELPEDERAEQESA